MVDAHLSIKTPTKSSSSSSISTPTAVPAAAAALSGRPARPSASNDPNYSNGSTTLTTGSGANVGGSAAITPRLRSQLIIEKACLASAPLLAAAPADNSNAHANCGCTNCNCNCNCNSNCNCGLSNSNCFYSRRGVDGAAIANTLGVWLDVAFEIAQLGTSQNLHHVDRLAKESALSALRSVVRSVSSYPTDLCIPPVVPPPNANGSAASAASAAAAAATTTDSVSDAESDSESGIVSGSNPKNINQSSISYNKNSTCNVDAQDLNFTFCNRVCAAPPHARNDPLFLIVWTVLTSIITLVETIKASEDYERITSLWLPALVGLLKAYSRCCVPIFCHQTLLLAMEFFVRCINGETRMNLLLSPSLANAPYFAHVTSRLDALRSNPKLARCHKRLLRLAAWKLDDPATVILAPATQVDITTTATAPAVCPATASTPGAASECATISSLPQYDPFPPAAFAISSTTFLRNTLAINLLLLLDHSEDKLGPPAVPDAISSKFTFGGTCNSRRPSDLANLNKQRNSYSAPVCNLYQCGKRFSTGYPDWLPIRFFEVWELLLSKKINLHFLKHESSNSADIEVYSKVSRICLTLYTANLRNAKRVYSSLPSGNLTAVEARPLLESLAKEFAVAGGRQLHLYLQTACLASLLMPSSLSQPICDAIITCLFNLFLPSGPFGFTLQNNVNAQNTNLPALSKNNDQLSTFSFASFSTSLEGTEQQNTIETNAKPHRAGVVEELGLLLRLAADCLSMYTFARKLQPTSQARLRTIFLDFFTRPQPCFQPGALSAASLSALQQSISRAFCAISAQAPEATLPILYSFVRYAQSPDVVQTTFENCCSIIAAAACSTPVASVLDLAVPFFMRLLSPLNDNLVKSNQKCAINNTRCVLLHLADIGLAAPFTTFTEIALFVVNISRTALSDSDIADSIVECFQKMESKASLKKRCVLLQTLLDFFVNLAAFAVRQQSNPSSLGTVLALIARVAGSLEVNRKASFFSKYTFSSGLPSISATSPSPTSQGGGSKHREFTPTLSTFPPLFRQMWYHILQLDLVKDPEMQDKIIDIAIHTPPLPFTSSVESYLNLQAHKNKLTTILPNASNLIYYLTNEECLYLLALHCIMCCKASDSQLNIVKYLEHMIQFKTMFPVFVQLTELVVTEFYLHRTSVSQTLEYITLDLLKGINCANPQISQTCSTLLLQIFLKYPRLLYKSDLFEAAILCSFSRAHQASHNHKEEDLDLCVYIKKWLSTARSSISASLLALVAMKYPHLDFAETIMDLSSIFVRKFYTCLRTFGSAMSYFSDEHGNSSINASTNWACYKAQNEFDPDISPSQLTSQKLVTMTTAIIKNAVSKHQVIGVLDAIVRIPVQLFSLEIIGTAHLCWNMIILCCPDLEESLVQYLQRAFLHHVLGYRGLYNKSKPAPSPLTERVRFGGPTVSNTKTSNSSAKKELFNEADFDMLGEEDLEKDSAEDKEFEDNVIVDPNDVQRREEIQAFVELLEFWHSQTAISQEVSVNLLELIESALNFDLMSQHPDCLAARFSLISLALESTMHPTCPSSFAQRIQVKALHCALDWFSLSPMWSTFSPRTVVAALGGFIHVLARLFSSQRNSSAEFILLKLLVANEAERLLAWCEPEFALTSWSIQQAALGTVSTCTLKPTSNGLEYGDYGKPVCEGTNVINTAATVTQTKATATSQLLIPVLEASGTAALNVSTFASQATNADQCNIAAPSSYLSGTRSGNQPSISGASTVSAPPVQQQQQQAQNIAASLSSQSSMATSATATATATASNTRLSRSPSTKRAAALFSSGGFTDVNFVTLCNDLFTAVAGISVLQWRNLVNFAWGVNPAIAFQMSARFPQNRAIIDAELKSLVVQRAAQPLLHRCTKGIDYLLTEENLTKDIPELRYLAYWEPVPPIQAVALFSPRYRGHPAVHQYALRSLNAFPRESVLVYVPQMVQALRYDVNGYIRDFIVRVAQTTRVLSHQVIWNMQANMYRDDDAKEADPMKPMFESILEEIVQGYSPQDKEYYEKQFAFFNKVTSISGSLKPFIKSSKEEKKRKIDQELASIEVVPGCYLPSNPESIVLGIDYKSGIPLQSHAKAPFLATFLIEREVYTGTPTSSNAPGTIGQRRLSAVSSIGSPFTDHKEAEPGSVAQVPGGTSVAASMGTSIVPPRLKIIGDRQNHREQVWQSAIFKVGDDCRQDMLVLQLIALFRTIFESAGLATLHLYPYRVVATGPGSGVIEVIPNALTRNQIGREKVNNLFDYYVSKYGAAHTKRYRSAQERFITSAAAYAVVLYVLQVKDRHNANIMFDESGHVAHIDFGFILDIAPRGHVETVPFKLTTEMLQIIGPARSPGFARFRRHVVQAFLALRRHADEIVSLVRMMADSGLPCFRGEGTLKRLHQRFAPEMSEREAVRFMNDRITESYESLRTWVYDWFQRRQNGITY